MDNKYYSSKRPKLREKDDRQTIPVAKVLPESSRAPRNHNQKQMWKPMFSSEYHQPRKNTETVTTKDIERTNRRSNQDPRSNPKLSSDCLNRQRNNELVTTKDTEYSRTPHRRDQTRQPTFPSKSYHRGNICETRSSRDSEEYHSRDPIRKANFTSSACKWPHENINKVANRDTRYSETSYNQDFDEKSMSPSGYSHQQSFSNEMVSSRDADRFGVRYRKEPTDHSFPSDYPHPRDHDDELTNRDIEHARYSEDPIRKRKLPLEFSPPQGNDNEIIITTNTYYYKEHDKRDIHDPIRSQLPPLDYPHIQDHSNKFITEFTERSRSHSQDFTMIPVFRSEYTQKHSSEEMATKNPQHSMPLSDYLQVENNDNISTNSDRYYHRKHDRHDIHDPIRRHMSPLDYPHIHENSNHLVTEFTERSRSPYCQDSFRKPVSPSKYTQKYRSEEVTAKNTQSDYLQIKDYDYMMTNYLQQEDNDDMMTTIDSSSSFLRYSQNQNREPMYTSTYPQSKGNMNEESTRDRACRSYPYTQDPIETPRLPSEYLQPQDNVNETLNTTPADPPSKRYINEESTRDRACLRYPYTQHTIKKLRRSSEYLQPQDNDNETFITTTAECSNTNKSQDPNGQHMCPSDLAFEAAWMLPPPNNFNSRFISTTSECSSRNESQDPNKQHNKSSSDLAFEAASTLPPPPDNVNKSLLTTTAKCSSTNKSKDPNGQHISAFETACTLPPPRIKEQHVKISNETLVNAGKERPESPKIEAISVENKPLTKKQRRKLRRKLNREAKELATPTVGNRISDSLNNRSAASGSMQEKQCSAKSFPKSIPKARDIVVYIKTEIGCLTKEQADQVLEILKAKLFALFNTNVTQGPTFRGKPSFYGGYLRLWCENDQSLSWLKNAVDGALLPSGEKLIVGHNRKDTGTKIPCSVIIPGIHNNGDIIRVLRYQNPWAKVNSWRFTIKHRNEDKFMLMMMQIPKDVVEVLLKRERRLCFLLGAVYVKFRNPSISNYPNCMENK